MNINDISLPILVVLFFVIFVSSTVQGTTSFGFNLVATPIFLIFLDPKLVIPILMPLTAAVNLGVILWNYQLPEFKKSSILILGGLIGLPIGILILSKSNPDYLNFHCNHYSYICNFNYYDLWKIKFKKKRISRFFHRIR